MAHSGRPELNQSLETPHCRTLMNADCQLEQAPKALAYEALPVSWANIHFLLATHYLACL